MEKRKSIRIGSRDSQLAMTQTRQVAERLKQRYPDYQYEIVEFKTKGDKILDKRLDKIGGKGLFIAELQAAMQSGEIDFAVHSLKDVPAVLEGNTEIIAIPERENRADALVLKAGMELEDLPEKPVLGTSSIRREIQLRKIFPQAEIKLLRGNVLTRLSKLDAGEYDGIILAAAGLQRLGLENRISQLFSFKELMPAVAQGALGIEAPKNSIYREMLLSINDPLTAQQALTERAFLKALDGSCSVPIAAYTEISQQQLTFYGLYGDAKNMCYDIHKCEGKVEDYQSMAEKTAEILKLKIEQKREKR